MSTQAAIDTDDRSPLGKFILQILAAVAELDRAFIIERTQTGYKSYRAAFAAGRVGNSRHSKSGKDLPVGRPKKVFRRDEAVKLRAGGMSLRAIALTLNVPFSTIRRSVEGVPK